MVVRIRWNSRTEEGEAARLQNVALAMASLLTPAALVAFTMALWSIAADLRWTGDFFISTGLLSHWEIWLAIAGVLLFSARLLDRYGRSAQNYAPDESKAVF